MSTIILITGIFAGIGIFLAMMYSVTQVILLDGWGRIAHGVTFGLVMAIMSALFFWESVGAARLIAVPLFFACFWTMVLEVRWYRIFPILLMGFSIVLVLGHVALNPR